MLPLNPLYEEVPVSEKPVVDGIYMTKWKGVPAWTEKEFKDGRWQTRFDWTGLLTHWLRPLPPERMEEWVRNTVMPTLEEKVLIEDFIGLKLPIYLTWNDLMPVVDKVRELSTAPNHPNGVTEQRIFDFSIMAPLNDVYRAVIKFFRWYNKQKPPTINL